MAGGGGSGSSNCGTGSSGGGSGGGLIGGWGCEFACSSCSYTGSGGTQEEGGNAAYYGSNGALNGSLGLGGTGGSDGYGYGAGGGGGYYGGGGAGYEGAGGGSSFVDSIIGNNVVHSQGVRQGDGLIIISWQQSLEPLCSFGCNDEQACNYDLEATTDDGSCDYCFCLDGTQWNDSLQGCVSTAPPLMDACGEGTYWDDEAQACLTIVTCSQDLDGDGMIGVEDLMQLLSVFGTNCVFDEPETSEWTCGDPVNYHGYDYETVQIGEQCWFAENCRYLPEVSPSSEGSEADPYYYVNDYQGTDVEAAKSMANYETYGVLYNWPAVMTEDICPSGWHIPSDGEFTQLTDFLGGEGVAGGKMKEAGTCLWWTPNEAATNSSGFTGLPGGQKNGGSFYDIGSHAHWWSTSALESGSDKWYRQLDYNGADVGFSTTGPDIGYSARCLKDTEE